MKKAQTQRSHSISSVRRALIESCSFAQIFGNTNPFLATETKVSYGVKTTQFGTASIQTQRCDNVHRNATARAKIRGNDASLVYGGTWLDPCEAAAPGVLVSRDAVPMHQTIGRLPCNYGVP
jgi:hypothetical protein